MSRSGGIISRIFRSIISSMGKNVRLVGEDHLGNKYYEKDADSKNERKASRWVETPGQEADPTFIPEVPTEWDSWLRRRRNNPPTQEELDRNYVMMIRTQQRAKAIESKEKGEKDFPVTETSYTETVSEDSFKRKFPKYDDFEATPGQFKGRKNDA